MATPTTCSAFIELSCLTKTALDNPGMRGPAASRSFCVLDEGELEGQTGFWIEDEDPGEIGFADAWEDVFWTHDEQAEAW